MKEPMGNCTLHDALVPIKITPWTLDTNTVNGQSASAPDHPNELRKVMCLSKDCSYLRRCTQRALAEKSTSATEAENEWVIREFFWLRSDENGNLIPL